MSSKVINVRVTLKKSAVKYKKQKSQGKNLHFDTSEIDAQQINTAEISVKKTFQFYLFAQAK